MCSTIRSSAYLRTQYLDAVKREADWSKRYGPDHIAVVNLNNEIKGLQRSLFTELSRIAETYKSDLEIARAREASLSSSLEQLMVQAKLTGQAQVELRELESNAQSYRALYDNFLQRFMQATQQQSFPITEARLITDASTPLRASSPRTTLIVAGGLFLGLLMGFGVGMWRERMNRTFRLPADVERYLGLDCLGVLPLLPSSVATPVPAGQSAFDSSTGIMRQVTSDPFSRFSETLRSVKVSADVSIHSRAVKVIGIVSTLPKEGKSTVSANFAQLIAHSGQRCVLIDGDLRNPTLTRRLAPGRSAGLLELVFGKATLEEVSIVDRMTGAPLHSGGGAGRYRPHQRDSRVRADGGGDRCAEAGCRLHRHRFPAACSGGRRHGIDAYRRWLCLCARLGLIQPGSRRQYAAERTDSLREGAWLPAEQG